MIQRIILASRFIAALAVTCIAIMATIIFFYGVALTIRFIGSCITDGAQLLEDKTLILTAIELVDLFLIGITLYVIAIGLYELFIDPMVPTMSWLHIDNIDDLKANVLGMLIVILGVLFLSKALAWDGESDLLSFGAAIALIIASITYFLNHKAKSVDKSKG